MMRGDRHGYISRVGKTKKAKEKGKKIPERQDCFSQLDRRSGQSSVTRLVRAWQMETGRIQEDLQGKSNEGNCREQLTGQHYRSPI